MTPLVLRVGPRPCNEIDPRYELISAMFVSSITNLQVKFILFLEKKKKKLRVPILNIVHDFVPFCKDTNIKGRYHHFHHRVNERVHLFRTHYIDW